MLVKFNDNAQSVYTGKKLKVKIFGASHSEKIGVQVKGFKGEKVDMQKLQEFLAVLHLYGIFIIFIHLFIK